MSHHEWSFSDHRPILLNLSDSVVRPARRKYCFKFEEAWTKDTSCENIIKEAEVWGDDQNPQKLESCLQKSANLLGHWGRNFNKNFKIQIRRIRSAIAQIYSSPPRWDFLINRLENDIDNLLQTEEICWKQQSREN